MKLYLASPLGFSEAGRYFYTNTMIPAIAQLGYSIIDPWALANQTAIDAIQAMQPSQERIDRWRALNFQIGANNAAAIHSSHILVAVLDGVDVDSGTAAEIGFACSLSKPIFGYRGDFRLSADNEGGIVNLQVEYFIRQSGGTICSDLNSLVHALAQHYAHYQGAN